MVVHNIQSADEFRQKVLGEKGLAVLDCFATWCGPCKTIAPKIVEYSEIFSEASFYKLDVDELSDIAQELEIRAMPTFVFFKQGEKVGEVVGANPVAIKTAIESNI